MWMGTLDRESGVQPLAFIYMRGEPLEDSQHKITRLLDLSRDSGCQFMMKNLPEAISKDWVAAGLRLQVERQTSWAAVHIGWVKIRDERDLRQCQEKGQT